MHGWSESGTSGFTLERMAQQDRNCFKVTPFHTNSLFKQCNWFYQTVTESFLSFQTMLWYHLQDHFKGSDAIYLVIRVHCGRLRIKPWSLYTERFLLKQEILPKGKWLSPLIRTTQYTGIGGHLALGALYLERCKIIQILLGSCLLIWVGHSHCNKKVTFFKF